MFCASSRLKPLSAMIARKPLARGNKVSVTFSVLADNAHHSVSVVGDFNEWDDSAHALKLSKKDGAWKKAVQLAPGRYEFRYFVDGERWENEPEADDHVWSPFFSQNSVIVVEG